MTDPDDLDLPALRTALGGWPKHRGPRLDLPLAEQVELLVELAVATRPEFRRSVPVSPKDHDVLISEVLVKFVEAVDNLTADRDRWRQLAEDRSAALLAALKKLDTASA